MFKRYIFQFSILFFILAYLFISNFIIADTGYSFAYDYIINKLEINNTKNKISLKNNNTLNLKNDILFDFVSINGFVTEGQKRDDKYSPSKIQLDETDIWIRSNGGDYSNKFSNLKLINKNNVHNLSLNFKIELDNNKFFKKKWMNNVETNPIFHKGLLFVVTPYKELIAVDILNKKIKWKFKSLKKIDSRGISLWINKNDESKSCIFVPIRNGLF